MRTLSSIRLLFLFAVTISLLALPGALNSGFQLPSIPLVHAPGTVITSNPSWVPAGASTDTEFADVYFGSGSEFTALCNGSLTSDDSSLTRAEIDQILGTNGSCSAQINLTRPVAAHGYIELEFNQAANFWGCFFDYGNSVCGQQIRQSIAHLINRDIFSQAGSCQADSTTGPVCGALDNTVPRGDELVTPIACSYDALSGYSESGTACVVGSDAGGWTGGTAYDCAASLTSPQSNLGTHPCTSPTVGTGGINGQCGAEGTPAPCPFPWMNGFGTADFCAAAQHLKNAFAMDGVPGVALDSNCVLNTATNSALQVAVIGHPVSIFVRVDTVRNQLGQGIARSMCAVFTGAFDLGCTTSSTNGSVSDACPNQSSTSSFITNAILCVSQAPETNFPGFTTSTTGTPTNGADGNSFTNSAAWEMYTAGFLFVYPFDGPTYFEYDSQFVTQTKGSNCYSQVLTGAAGDYMYACDHVFDAYAAQLEFGGCSTPTVGSDPSAGQTTPTFGTCQSITSPGIAVGAGAKIINAPLGTSFPVAITITGIGGFGGTGTLTVGAVTGTATGVTATGTQSVTLPAGDSIASLITVTFSSTATAGTFSIPVTVTVGAVTYPTITISGTIAPASSTAGSCTTTCANLNGIVGSLSSISAGYLAEREHAAKVLTLPVFNGIDTFGYLAPPTACASNTGDCAANGWHGFINQVGIGATHNFWTWLNAWNACPSPSSACTPGGPIDQGFSGNPSRLSPLSASNVWDFYIIRNIWDSIFKSPTPYFAGPIATRQNGGLIDWLTLSHQFPVANSALTYTPPAGTVQSLRATLRPGIAFHDGQPLTAFDVAMSYNFLIKDGSFQAGGLLEQVTGITILGPYQFDINLSGSAGFTESNLGSVTVLPGHLWSNCNTISGWNNFVNSELATISASGALIVPIGITGTGCTLGGAMDSPDSSVTFNPSASGLMVGSGPWVCESFAGVVGTGCVVTGQPCFFVACYTLTRNGCTITSVGTQCVPAGTIISSPGPTSAATPVSTPNGSVLSTYSRSPSAFAKYIWSKITGTASNDFLALTTVSNTCQQTAGSAFVASTTCANWQNGIGGLGALTGSYSLTDCNGTNQCNVEAPQVNLVNFFKNNAGDWVAPIAFPYTSTTLGGTTPLNPTLFEGVSTLQSTTNGGSCTTGWLLSNAATTGYDC